MRRRLWIIALMALFMILPAERAEAHVAVNATRFPDENFRNFVQSYDKDNDGMLSDTELKAVKTIDCSGKNIKSLKGIEYFEWLEYLNCSNNALTSLDIHENTILQYLICNRNRLTYLELDINNKPPFINEILKRPRERYTDKDGYFYDKFYFFKSEESETQEALLIVDPYVKVTNGFKTSDPTGLGIFITTDGNGTAKSSVNSGNTDDDVKLTATPNAGYQFKEWQVISGGVTIVNNVFTLGSESVEIKAIFTKIVEEPAKPATPTKTTDSAKTTAEKKVTVGALKYKVSGTTAKVTGPAKKSAKKISVPAYITVGNTPYIVTEISPNAFKGMKKLTTVTIGKKITKIGKQAFLNCKKLKKITIKTTKLTKSKVGAKAFKGIYKKAVVKCPKSKKAAYKKILLKKGMKKSMKFK